MKRSHTLRGVTLATVLATPPIAAPRDNKPWIRTSFGQATVAGEIQIDDRSIPGRQ